MCNYLHILCKCKHAAAAQLKWHMQVQASQIINEGPVLLTIMGRRGNLTVLEMATIISELVKVKLLQKYIIFCFKYHGRLNKLAAAPDVVRTLAYRRSSWTVYHRTLSRIKWEVATNSRFTSNEIFRRVGENTVKKYPMSYSENGRSTTKAC